MGTGNDLSNALGFGGIILINLDEFLIDSYSSLMEILLIYNESTVSKVDVWQIKVVLDDILGEIKEISNESKKTKTNDQGDRITCFKKSFINYVSIGFDAQVGFQFSRRRCQNRCCNKFLYFWEGLKKNLSRKITLNSYIKSLKTVNLDYKEYIKNEHLNQQISDDLDNINILEKIGRVETVFKSELSLDEDSDTEAISHKIHKYKAKDYICKIDLLFR